MSMYDSGGGKNRDTSNEGNAPPPEDVYQPYSGHPYQIDLVVSTLRSLALLNGYHWRQGREDPESGFTMARGIGGERMAIYFILSDAENNRFETPSDRDTFRVPYLKAFRNVLAKEGISATLGQVPATRLPTIWVSPLSVYNVFFLGKPVAAEAIAFATSTYADGDALAGSGARPIPPQATTKTEDDREDALADTQPTLKAITSNAGMAPREVMPGRLESRLGDYMRWDSPQRVKRRSYRTPLGVAQRVTFADPALNTPDNLSMLVGYLRTVGVYAEMFPGQTWIYITPEQNPALCRPLAGVR